MRGILLCSRRAFKYNSVFRSAYVRAGRPVQAPRARLRTRAVKETASDNVTSTAVTIDNDADESSTVVIVDAQNVPGLLTAMTAVFRDLQLEVTRAEVDTSNGVVRDMFLVTDSSGSKVTDSRVLAKLQDALSSTMAEERRPGRLAWGPASATRAQILMGATRLVQLRAHICFSCAQGTVW